MVMKETLVLFSQCIFKAYISCTYTTVIEYRVRNLDQINLYGVKVFEINSIVLANKKFLLEMLNLSKNYV